MRVHITGRQVEVTPALRKFAEDKLKKVDKLLDGPAVAHVVLAVEKHRHLAEIQVRAPARPRTCTSRSGTWSRSSSAKRSSTRRS
jgi:ribosomal subunit interface protein